MYNKYIGNTGKFVRVEDQPRTNAHQAQRPVNRPSPPIEHPTPQHSTPQHSSAPSAPADIKNKPSLFGGLGGGLSSLFGGHGGGLGGLGGALGGGLKGITGLFDHLPFGLDIGDILLFLLLLFFFLESGDEEFLIILAVIAYNMFKER